MMILFIVHKHQEWENRISLRRQSVKSSSDWFSFIVSINARIFDPSLQSGRRRTIPSTFLLSSYNTVTPVAAAPIVKLNAPVPPSVIVGPPGTVNVYPPPPQDGSVLTGKTLETQPCLSSILPSLSAIPGPGTKGAAVASAFQIVKDGPPIPPSVRVGPPGMVNVNLPPPGRSVWRGRMACAVTCAGS
jgi:hypothetical protein